MKKSVIAPKARPSPTKIHLALDIGAGSDNARGCCLSNLFPVRKGLKRFNTEGHLPTPAVPQVVSYFLLSRYRNASRPMDRHELRITWSVTVGADHRVCFNAHTIYY